MGVTELVLGLLLLVSGAGNFFQNKQIDKAAHKVKEVSDNLQIADAEIKKRDEALIKAETLYSSKRRRFTDALQQQGFIISSQARQLELKNPDKPHAKHKATTKDFSAILGKPSDPATAAEVWESAYLTEQKKELIKSKAQEQAAMDEVKDLRDELRQAQERESQLLDDLDITAGELIDLTDKHTGLFSQFQTYINYGIIAAVLFGILYVWSVFRGLLFKNATAKYKRAMHTFAVLGDEGNAMAANVLQEMHLEIPSAMKATLYRNQVANKMRLQVPEQPSHT